MKPLNQESHCHFLKGKRIIQTAHHLPLNMLALEHAGSECAKAVARLVDLLDTIYEKDLANIVPSQSVLDILDDPDNAPPLGTWLASQGCELGND
jgi:hypothetical protein